jgi:glutamate/tyrosine decarboxylase-like PLP-dependent enzyme
VHRQITAHLTANADPSHPVVAHKTPNELSAAVDVSLPETGEGLGELPGWVDTYLEHSVRTGSSRYYNQLWSGFSVPGYIGDAVAAASNTSMFTYEVAPMATLIEHELLSELGRLVGFDDGEGLFVTGGSNANMVAMHAARHKVAPDFLRRGADGQRLVMFISEAAHYSFKKAANLMGIGTDNVIGVPTDAHGRMSPELLGAAIDAARAEGATPFFVAATSGTTVIGAFDPIVEIAAICEAQDLWFHIDGAWGGSVAMSERLRPLIAGSERADSFTWDQHKMLGMPLICSTILFRQKGTLRALNNVGGSEYIFHDLDEATKLDLGPISLQCGRRVDALKLWLAWKTEGRAGFAAKIEHLFDTASYMVERLEAHPRFRSVSPVASVNIGFLYVPEGPLDDEALVALNLRARERLAKSGKALVNHALWNGQRMWRMVIANFAISHADIDRLLLDIEAVCEAEVACA